MKGQRSVWKNVVKWMGLGRFRLVIVSRLRTIHLLECDFLDWLTNNIWIQRG